MPSAAHCEAKKHSYRQTQDGVVISFVLHPNEVPESLTLAALGTRFMLAFAQIGDDEQPLSGAQAHGTGSVSAGEGTAGSPRPERVPFSKKPASVRAALLCRQFDFQAWVGQQKAEPGQTEKSCADFIRTKCGVFSRAKLDTDQTARLKWEMIESQYMADTGRIASPDR